MRPSPRTVRPQPLPTFPTATAWRCLACGALLLLAAGRPAAAGTLYATANDGDFVSIDTDTFAVTTIGSLGVPEVQFGGAAYDPVNDRVLMVKPVNDPAPTGRQLFAVDVNTGAATAIGTHGLPNLNGLAIDGNGTIFASPLFSPGRFSPKLYTLNPTNASATSVGSLSSGVGSLAYDSIRDRLVGLTDYPGHTLVEIDRTDATQTVLKNLDLPRDTGLAFDPDKDLYWGVDNLDGGRLFSIDPNNAFTMTVVATGIAIDVGGGGFDGYQGLAYRVETAVIPEPSTGLLALVGIGLRRRARRPAA